MQESENCLKELASSLDVYGQSVSLTFKGKETFTTWPGVIASCIVIIIVLAFAIYRAMILFGRIDPNVSQKSFLEDLDLAEPFMPFQPSSENGTAFDVAFGLGAPLDPTIAYYQVSLITYVYVDGVKKKITQKLPFGPCGTQYFNYPDQETVQMYGIGNYMCIYDKSNISF